MSIGHIITGLAIHFVPRKIALFAPLECEIFYEDFLVRAEIIIDLERLEDAEKSKILSAVSNCLET